MLSDSKRYPYQHRKPKWLIKATLVFVIVISLVVSSGIAEKAFGVVAQQILENAFEQSLLTGETVNAWFLSDIWPAMSLSFPNKQKKLFVVAGAGKKALRFGPGHIINSAYPGQSGKALIVSFSQRYFEFLPSIEIGELIEVQSVHGNVLFEVTATRVMTDNPYAMNTSSRYGELLLITPYQQQADSSKALYYVVEAHVL